MTRHRPSRPRKAVVFCPSCEQWVGLIKTSWNGGAARAVAKTARHMNRNRQWCPGGQLTVPDAVIMEMGEAS